MGIKSSTYYLPTAALALVCLGLLYYFQDNFLLVENTSPQEHTKSGVSQLVGNVNEDVWPEEDLRKCSQKERLSHMKSYCKQRPELSQRHLMLDARAGTFWRLLVDVKHRILMCTVPKAAGSSWKMAFAKSMRSNLPSTYSIHVDENLRRLGLEYLDAYGTSDKRNEILRNFTKVIVVRHPLDRLVSAWKDKLLTGTDFRGRAYKEHGEGAYWTFLKELLNTWFTGGPARDTKSQVPFKDFVNYIAASAAPYDKHWDTYFHLCHPCLIDYDYVIKTETMDEDSKHILKMISKNKTDPLSLGNLHKTPKSTSKQQFRKDLDQYYKDIDPLTVARLLEIYKLDMDIFGYSWNSPHHLATCGHGANMKCC